MLIWDGVRVLSVIACLRASSVGAANERTEMRSAAMILATVLLMRPGGASAQEPAPSAAAELPGDGENPGDFENAALEQFEAQLKYQTGQVVLGDDLATVNLGEELRFLGPDDAEKVLVAWGNPPGNKVLGMLLPVNLSLFDQASWAVIVTYSEEGHVDDDDAKSLDYDALLKEMQESTQEANKERVAAGYSAVQLLRWAEPPHYDEAARKLYWAQELAFDGAAQHTLNYDIRILGRKGVLELSAIAGIEQLPTIKAEMPKVLAAVDFNPGMRYADFNPDIDEVAGYGIGALVAGKLAAKAGFFKVILGLLVAGKKFIAVAAAGLFMGLKRLFGRKKDETETAPPAA